MVIIENANSIFELVCFTEEETSDVLLLLEGSIPANSQYVISILRIANIGCLWYTITSVSSLLSIMWSDVFGFQSDSEVLATSCDRKTIIPS